MSIAALFGAVLLYACGANTPAPAILSTEPGAPEPGALVLVLGEGLNPVESVRLGDRTLESFTPVNAGLLTAIVPRDVAAGESALEVRLGGGRRAIAYLNVRVSAPAVSAPMTVTDSPPAVAGSRQSEGPNPVATAPPRIVRPPAVPPPIPFAVPGRARDADGDRDKGQDENECDDDGDGDRKKDRGPGRGRGR
ncbi:MAG: hypothetical protein HYX51_04345 [Chloroflexi bacterium]|nr:hypothetical protein [Chloroflexota bacterium]